HTYAVHGQFGIPLHLAICKNCGLSYLNPRWNKDRYLKYYAQEYDTHYRKKEVDASMSGEMEGNAKLPMHGIGMGIVMLANDAGDFFGVRNWFGQFSF
ncbi:MAG: hypothetical protein AAFP92_22645, partial [Bacteroidota bacterium]